MDVEPRQQPRRLEAGIYGLGNAAPRFARRRAEEAALRGSARDAARRSSRFSACSPRRASVDPVYGTRCSTVFFGRRYVERSFAPTARSRTRFTTSSRAASHVPVGDAGIQVLRALLHEAVRAVERHRMHLRREDDLAVAARARLVHELLENAARRPSAAPGLRAPPCGRCGRRAATATGSDRAADRRRPARGATRVHLVELDLGAARAAPRRTRRSGSARAYARARSQGRSSIRRSVAPVAKSIMARMKSLWNDAEAAQFTGPLGLRVYTSRLLGPRHVARAARRRQHLGQAAREEPLRRRRGRALREGQRLGPRDHRARRLHAGARSATCCKLAGLDAALRSADGERARTHMLRAGAPAPSVETILHAILPLQVRRPHPCRRGAGGHQHARRREAHPRDLRRARGGDPLRHAGFDLAAYCAREFPSRRAGAPSAWCCSTTACSRSAQTRASRTSG